MSLTDYYNNNYGSEKVASAQYVELEKTAAEQDAEMVEAICEKLSEDDCEKLAAAIEVMDAEGITFDSGVEKIAAAAEIVDESEYNSDEEAEKVAEDETEKVAAEYYAAGQIFAQGFLETLNEDK
jgi:hypothetical protein